MAVKLQIKINLHCPFQRFKTSWELNVLSLDFGAFFEFSKFQSLSVGNTALSSFFGLCVKVIYYWYFQPENIDLVNEKPKVILANHL